METNVELFPISYKDKDMKTMGYILIDYKKNMNLI